MSGSPTRSSRAGRRLDHVHTHSGHPVSCAVGVAVLDILERDGLIAQAGARGEYLRAAVARALEPLGRAR